MPHGWLGRWAAPPDCLTWLQMVLKSRPGIQPEGPGPLRLHRNCAICLTHCGITLFNLDIPYHHDEDLAAMFFIEGYGSGTAGPRRGVLSFHAALIAQHSHKCTFFMFSFLFIFCCVVFTAPLPLGLWAQLLLHSSGNRWIKMYSNGKGYKLYSTWYQYECWYWEIHWIYPHISGLF